LRPEYQTGFFVTEDNLWTESLRRPANSRMLQCNDRRALQEKVGLKKFDAASRTRLRRQGNWARTRRA
jgi:hypothetical protein